MATMRLFAEFSDLVVIRQFIAQAIREAGLDERVIPDLQLAVDEVCANVLEHGYDGQCGEIEVVVEPIEGGVQASVRDWGAVFDPQSIPIPDVTAPLEQRRPGGLGLYLVRQVMDDVCFEFDAQQGNRTIMTKRIRPKEGKR
jgi:serine/threonine-protein kinase RsbW